MEKIISAGTDLRVGDEVIIVKHKFPELNPENTRGKMVMKTAGELRAIHNKCKKPGEPEMSFYKNSYFEYELKGINCIGMTGEIVEIDLAPRTESEIETGEVAIYVVEFTTKSASWKGKRMTFYPEEVRKIRRRVYQEVEDDTEEENEENYEEESDLVTQKGLFGSENY